jgi:serine protease Do
VNILTMKKLFIPSLLVMIVLLLGMLLAYFLYTLNTPKQDKISAPEVKTEIVEKKVEVKVPVKIPVNVPEKSSLKKIIKDTQSKVVQIETYSGSQGSGFLYNNKGDFVTNAHVVGFEVYVTVKTSDQQTYQGQVIGRSDSTDIALVRVPELATITPLKIEQKKAELGDDVVAMGSPLGLQNTVTVGIISGLDRSFQGESFYYDSMYQITAPVSPGNSGGPIVSGTDGSVLGINSAKHSTEHIGFSIPIYTVLPTLKSWSKNPMSLSDYGEDYEFESPEYDGDITDDYSGEYGEDYGTDAGLDIEEYPEDDPYYDGLTSEDAAGAVYVYYEYINNRDYEQAYNLIGGGWKASLSSQEKFAAGYANTLSTSITITKMYMNEDGTYQVELTLEAQEYVNNSEQTSYYEMSYVVGLEDGIPKLLGGAIVTE